jgi:hypothetical protein
MSYSLTISKAYSSQQADMNIFHSIDTRRITEMTKDMAQAIKDKTLKSGRFSYVSKEKYLKNA